MTDIKLYSLATPNGQKVSTFLEAAGIEYDATKIDILAGDQFSDEFISINPNSKIPAIIDLKGPDGKTHHVFESGAILWYLGKKFNKFIPTNPIEESEMMQWLFFQVGGVGPMFGQFGHFYRFGKDKCPHPYPVERYGTETKRLLTVLEKRLEGIDWLVGDQISLVDFATAPWVVCLDKIYKANDFFHLRQFKNINGWLTRFLDFPGVSRGMSVCQIIRD